MILSASSSPKERFYCLLFQSNPLVFFRQCRDRFECHYLSSGGKWDFSCPAPGRFYSRHGGILHDYSRFNVHSDSHDRLKTELLFWRLIPPKCVVHITYSCDGAENPRFCTNNTCVPRPINVLVKIPCVQCNMSALLGSL